MAKEEKEEIEQEYNSGIESEEGMLAKLLRAGFIALGTAALGKKVKNSKNALKYLDNDIVKTTAVAATSMALSDDDDKLGDIASASLAIAIGSGNKYLRESILNGDMNLYKQVHKYAKNMDNYYNKISLFNINFVESIIDSSKTIYNKKYEKIISNSIGNEDVSKFDIGIKMASAGIGTAFEMLSSPFKKIMEHGFKKGIDKILESGINSPTYKKYNYAIAIEDEGVIQKLKIFDGHNFSATRRISDKLDIPDFEKQDDIWHAHVIQGTSMKDVSELEYRKFEKYQKIEQQTRFQDTLGTFTKYDEKTGQMQIRFDRLFNEGANYGKMLNQLAKEFEDSYRTDKSYHMLDDNQKEQLFVKYLESNKLGELVSELYNKKDLVSYGEVNDLIKDQSIYELSDQWRDFFVQGGKSTFIKSDKENNIIIGLTNNKLLKNFAFTNVVKKQGDTIVDQTAMDGNLIGLNLLGILEDNLVGHYKNPLAKKLDQWNPLKLLEHRNRMKNIYVNDYLKYTSLEDGYLYNGHRITKTKVKKSKTDYIYDIHTFYEKSESNAYKYDSKKSTIDIINESYEVKRVNEKNNLGYRDILNIYRQDGFKSAMEAASSSHINPFGIRYQSGKIRRVKNDEGYYKEGSIINDAIDWLDDTIDDSKVLNTIRDRESSKVTLDQLRNDNASAEEALLQGLVKNFFSKTMRGPQSVDITKNISKHMRQSLKEILDILNEEHSLKKDKNIQDNFLEGSINLIKQARKYLKTVEKHGTFGVTMNKLDNPIEGIGKLYQYYASKNDSAHAIFMEKTFNILSAMNNPINLFDYITNAVSIDKKSIESIVGKLGSADQTIKDLKKFYNVKDEIKTKVLATATNRMKIADNFVNEYNSINDMENPSSLFNRSYEARLGYEYNKLLKNQGIDTSGLKTYGKFDEIKQQIYVPPEVQEAFEQGMIPDPTDKYDLVGALNNIKHNQFVQRDEKYTSAVLVESTIKRHLNTKSIMDLVGKLITKNKYEYTNAKYIKRVKDEAVNGSWSTNVIYKSTNRGGKIEETTFNVFMKQSIAGLQNALEVIGVERVPNKKLGDSFIEQYKNFFKYRYVPLAGAVLGAIAVNSFSDMIVPDEVPIIGNGIVGVGTRAYATARVGLQYALKYTGALSLMRSINDSSSYTQGIIDNGLTHFFDLLMDPEEMIDVYFKGKPIEVKKNRNWFTAGRQSGEGEEFGQYRPHLLYTLGNPSAGIYSNKFEKFFRKDFLLTKYPWYVLDPYKEEREAYEKFGLAHPKTEQLFKDIPVIGHFLSATVGEVIKPTQYVGEDQWRVGENLMLNPNYDERNPYSPKYIEFKEPNRIVQSVFEAIEDIKTFSGLQGYTLGKITEMVFGASNPYQNDVVLSSLDKDTSYYRNYEKLQLGGMFGTTEGIRRLLDSGNSLGSIEMNPIRQRIPEYLPEYFSNGNNPYSSLDYAEYIFGEEFDEASTNKGIREELKTLRKLSMLAPRSSNFNELKTVLNNSKENLSEKELKYFYETISYANEYGKRDYLEKNGGFSKKESIRLTIDKKISPTEFISEGKRYKFSAVEDDFNELSKKYGSSKASRMMKELDEQFSVGHSYSFEINERTNLSVGTDADGDYLKIDSEDISNNIKKDKHEFKIGNFNIVGGGLNLALKYKMGLLAAGSPSSMAAEKILGKRTVYQEWSAETVQSPYFRDWDTPISSFVEPYFNLSANSLISFQGLYKEANKSFIESSTSTINILGLTSLAGVSIAPVNTVLGRTSKSSEYKKETEIQDEIEKIKFISGDKSYYNMTGDENLEQFKDMMNEQDAVYFEDLVNVTDEDERKKILRSANDRMANVLKTIWNRQAKLRHGTSFNDPYDVQLDRPSRMEVTNIGAYTGNVDQLRNLLKASYGYGYSKLDSKRQNIIDSYRGGISQMEGEFIARKMYQQYNSSSNVISTIYPKGNINIIQTEE